MNKKSLKKEKACPQCGKPLGKCPICKSKLIVTDGGSLMDDNEICYVRLSCNNPECMFNDAVYHLTIQQIQECGTFVEE